MNTDISHTQEYSRFIKAYYGLDTAFEFGLPVHFKHGEAHIPFREYLVPGQSLPWRELCENMYKKYKASWLELRVADVPLEGGLEETPFVAFFLDIPPHASEELLLESMDKKTRNEVRRSMHADFTMSIEGEEAVPELVTLYQENMQRHGTPPKSSTYFPKLFETMGRRAVLLCARNGGRLAGANVLLVGDTDARVLMNFSRKEFWPAYVNNLLYWESIKYAMAKGLSRLDFGGGLRNDHSHNHFKEGFGARRVTIYGITMGSLRKRLQKFFSRKVRNMRLRFASMWSK